MKEIVYKKTYTEEWTTYVPTFTGFGTPSTVNFRYRRVGDSIEIEGHFVAGTTTTDVAEISLPSGLNVDTSKLSTANHVVGYMAWDQTTALALYVLATGNGSYNTSVLIGIQSAAYGGYSQRQGNQIASSGQNLTIRVTGIPIAEWDL